MMVSLTGMGAGIGGFTGAGTGGVLGFGVGAIPGAIIGAGVGGAAGAASGVIAVGMRHALLNWMSGSGGGGFSGGTETGPDNYPKDVPNKDTNDWSAHFDSEAEARQFVRQKIGRNPVKVEPYKFRSQNGKWQYRAKPADVADGHIHLEELDPQTGTVKQNVHCRWKPGTER